MTKISFLCEWGDSPKTLLEKYKKQTPNNSGIWKNLVGVDNPSMADVLIVMGNYNNLEKLPKAKEVLQFRREPDFIESFNPISENFFDYTNGYHVSTWQYVSKSLDEFIKTNPRKSKLASGVTSDKWEHRNKFFERIRKLDIKVDLYGKNYNKLHPQFKDKSLEKYKFSIAIENSSQENYFTEKINDCFLFLTLPIYWGCPNIFKFFPEDSLRLIDINNPSLIIEILTRPVEKKNEDALREARNLVLYKYNIWPTIQNLIN
jgi:hypothetical protein